MASTDGVFRSNDAGRCWTKIFSGGISDLAFLESAGKTVLYAARFSGETNLGQIILRTDDGDVNTPSWNPTPIKVSGPDSVPLLVGPAVRIQLASSHGVIWAIADQLGEGNETIGVYRTNADGVWESRQQPTDQKGNNRCDGQCGYSFALGVNPSNADDVLAWFFSRRHRWAWIALTIFSFNPVAWIINFIYLLKRWAEDSVAIPTI